MKPIEIHSYLKPVKRLLALLRLEKRNIYYVYFYAIFSGLLYLSLPIGIQAITSLMFAQQVSTSLVVLISMVILGVFLNGYMYILQMQVTERIQVRLFSLFSLAYADRLPKLKEDEIDEFHLPEIVNRFFDTAALQKGISKVLLDLPAASVQILFGLTLLSFYHQAFILFSLILVFILYLVLRFAVPIGINTSMEESEYKYKVGYWIEEIARNLTTFKLAGETDLPLRKTNEYVEGYLKARGRHFKILQIQFWTFALFKTTITAFLLVAGCYLFFLHKINIGQFIASEVVIIMVLNSVEKIIAGIDSIYDLLTSLEKASKILDNPVEEFNSLAHLQTDQINIQLHHLSFRYPNSNKSVLNDISVNIKQGEKIALIGTKGSGKSTLLRLLTGSFSSFEGAVMINNQPLFSYDLNLLRSKFGTFFTNSEIFEGTLMENIAIDRTDRYADRILVLAEHILIKDFINNDKEGVYQLLSTHGNKLPESIKAKILLCRALIKDPAVILLDDFRYLLTKRDSNLITNFLLDTKKTFTMLIRTSDEELMKKCDRIIFLHEGRVIADGSFDAISSTEEYKIMMNNEFHK